MESLDPPNGVLRQIPGEYISAGSSSLPIPGPGQPAELWAEVDTTSVWSGRVRIKYQLRKHRHGKSTSWFWAAMFAERVGDTAL